MFAVGELKLKLEAIAGIEWSGVVGKVWAEILTVVFKSLGDWRLVFRTS